MYKFLKKVTKVIGILLLLHFVYAVVLIWISPPFTFIQLKSLSINLFSEDNFKRDYIDFEDMGKNCKWAVVASEDQKFAVHHGFDVESIKRAFKNNNSEHKKVIGGSTISQQVAKNIFLWNGRNWFRKGFEAYSTFLIELFWSKKRILEMYLNVAEMGPNVFGIEAAAQYHFKTTAKKLTLDQAAFIASLLPSPVKRTREKKQEALKRKAFIKANMNFLKDDAVLNKLINDK